MKAIEKLFVIVILIVVAAYSEHLFAGAPRSAGLPFFVSEILSGSCVTYALLKSVKLANTEYN
ncbi:MAG: hypothetical protein ABR886_00685 [Dehalococcoidales bacterium]|jgi:hypothetical protein